MVLYGASDIFKNKFLEEFSELTVGSVLGALALAALLGLYIVIVYRVTFRGVLFNRSFAMGLILLSMITSMVILTVTSNVVLSLGMVGALSIVRFRTAVKDPMDTVYMFWAIASGITAGAGLVYISMIGCVFIGLVFLVISFTGDRIQNLGYLVIVRGEGAGEEARKAVEIRKDCRLKSVTCGEQSFEMVLELRAGKDINTRVDALRAMEGVTKVTATAYGSNTLL